MGAKARRRREERFQRNEARKDKKLERQLRRRQQRIDAKQGRRDSRMAGRLSRIEARQGGKTERVRIRNERMMANVATRQGAKTERHVASVENGFNPDAWKEEGMKAVAETSKAGGQVFSAWLGKKNGAVSDLIEDATSNIPTSSGKNNTGMIIGGIVLAVTFIGGLVYMLLPKKKKFK